MSRMLIFVFLGMLTLFGSVFGGQIEGRFFPVVRDTHVTRIEADGTSRSFIWGSSRLLRDCSFVRLEWRIGIPVNYAVIDLMLLEGSKVRRGSMFDFGPWQLHATPRQLANRSFATIIHRCHPFWLTETSFYRSQTEISERKSKSPRAKVRSAAKSSARAPGK